MAMNVGNSKKHSVRLSFLAIYTQNIILVTSLRKVEQQ
jgi:hypothetical protein